MHAEDIRLLLLSNKTHGVRGRGTGDGVHSIRQRRNLSQKYQPSSRLYSEDGHPLLVSSQTHGERGALHQTDKRLKDVYSFHLLFY